MAKVGRRPGGADTRAEIVAAASLEFAEGGYAGASLRAIARRAGVDPALVHHYFADKSELFVAAMDLPGDPQAVAQEATVPGGGFLGERVVERFLAQWEEDGVSGSPAFVAMAQAVASSPEAADAMREFLAERLTHGGGPFDDVDVAHVRRALISSQLVGLGWTRYVLRIEPLASAPRAVVARWAGPTLDRYFTLDPPTEPPN
jgi:AcrR family transcriptional regulator